MLFSIVERIYFKGIYLLSASFLKCIKLIPYFKFINETENAQTPISFGTWYRQRILGRNRFAYWPVNATSTIVHPQNIYVGVGTLPGYMGGCYIQGIGKIYFGDYTLVAQNVGVISANHDLYDSKKHIIEEVHIGNYCWLGMGSLIMPGVILGDYTIVAAGSVVTKSFPKGLCVIGGNPAKILKTLDFEKCIFHENPFKYHGYIKAERFEAYRKKHLNI